ncbi:hypothetical protein DWQ65_03310 [Treponema phagedenis]|uniref:hypothetical protein n=1 Tax=Treponema phagedenis TaxID=162 RepID=UPI00197CBF4E|nr:hypothetical protein [Treponema phagedenis]QSH99120.1 hypothetical protein DWQ65_03310 [Treponema phagedenis]
MDKIRMRTNAGSINLRVTTKDGSPCEVWNGGKKIAEMQSGTPCACAEFILLNFKQMVFD